jgi:hypothetical protein
MTQNKIYRYLGRNGMVTTPVLLEGVTPIIMYRLISDEDMILTNGKLQAHQIDVFEDELNDWYEIAKAIED